jgi:choline dehydrogenase-like flavoprotein
MSRRVVGPPYARTVEDDTVAPPRRQVVSEAPASSWVVVGAGSGGCVVAARLSEDPHRSVTLLEAGPDLRAEDLGGPLGGPDFLAALEVPGRTFADLVASRTTGSERSPYRRGRGIGGSSAVNAMVALRGDADLYDAWGWADADASWAAVQIPQEEVSDADIGPVDRALLAAAPDAERAILTRRDGRRVTSAEASLWPALGRPNLVVRAETPVERLEFDHRRVTGVRLLDASVVEADHVVLCAGAIHSPTILLRSNVDTEGIGEGLQEHPSVPLTLALRSGAVAEPGSLVVGSLLRRGPLQLLPMNHLGPAAPGFGLLMPALMRPRSHSGSVRLDRDPLAPPVVDFAMLEHPDDVAELVVGVQAALHLLDAPAFRAIVETTYIDEFGTTADELDADEALERWVRRAVGDYVHASSSCAMGRVVDQDGALVGYRGVYVCDASVFPSIPDVNTHLPTTMLAERLVARWRRLDRSP